MVARRRFVRLVQIGLEGVAGLLAVYLALFVTGAARAVASKSLVAASCATTMTVVAHEDDDLLFINPAVQDDIAAGRCLVTIFVTAGDDGQGQAYWRERERGPMAAYAMMAGVADRWKRSRLRIGGRSLTRRELAGSRITLIYMRLPDGYSRGRARRESLQALWLGRVRSVHSLDAGTPYTRKALVKTLTGLMDRYEPGDIRTLDYVHSYGDGDHNDHHTVGYLTFLAQNNYHLPHQVTGYLGYPGDQRRANLPRTVAARKLATFLAYAVHDRRVCRTDQACMHNSYRPRFSRCRPVGSATSFTPDPLAADIPSMPAYISLPNPPRRKSRRRRNDNRPR